MKKWTLLLMMAAVLTAGISTYANAEVVRLDARACEALADLVYLRVIDAGVPGVGGRGGLSHEGTDKLMICQQTAHAVSSGFSRAMADLHLYVTWPTPEQQRGDVCESVHLSECYPSQDPYMPPMALSSAFFVMNSWKAVQSTVEQTTSADASHFSAAALDQQLKFRLNEKRAGGRRNY